MNSSDGGRFAAQLWDVPMLWRDSEGQVLPVAPNNIMTTRNLSVTIARTSEAPDGDTGLSFQLLTENWQSIGSEDKFVIISDRFALMQSVYFGR